MQRGRRWNRMYSRDEMTIQNKLKSATQHMYALDLDFSAADPFPRIRASFARYCVAFHPSLRHLIMMLVLIQSSYVTL